MCPDLAVQTKGLARQVAVVCWSTHIETGFRSPKEPSRAKALSSKLLLAAAAAFFFFFSPGCFLHPVLQEPAWSHSNQYQWSFLYDHSPEHVFFSFLCLYPEELIWSPWDLQRLTLGPWGSGTFPSASTDKPASPYLGHPPPSFCAPHPSSSASLGLLDFTV